MPIRLHEEDPALLREAMTFTSASTGFGSRLIEKDYFCSVVLEYLATSDDDLLFKGGTCLAKIHGDFYRLSEDLDFTLPMAPAEAHLLALGFDSTRWPLYASRWRRCAIGLRTRPRRRR